MGRLFRVFIVFALLSSLVPAPFAEAEETGPATEQKVLIEEVKLNDTSGVEPLQFVEVYNLSDQEIDLSQGWLLEYAKYNFPASECDNFSWKSLFPGSNTTVSEFELSGVIPVGDSVYFSLPAGKVNKTTGGSFRLLGPPVGETVMEHDLVGWGFSSSPAACKEDAQVSLSSSAKGFHRKLDCGSGAPLDTDNNSSDFVVNTVPSPGEQTGPTVGDCGGGTGGGTDDPTLPPAESDCDGVIINELLPNPEGSDGGNEFIELYNPANKTISLENCQLQTSANSKIYEFGDLSLSSKKYLALYDSETSLTLANSSGGTVWLLDHDDVELDQIEYQPNLADDVAWARFDVGWKQTYSPTPGAENILQSTKPCPEGQIRSLETNRCRSSVLTAALLKPCRSDQFRNPLTNRCKLKNPASSVLKPCDSDQFRNPETNRCKKVGSGSTLKPCNPGQERNPETNRCRKVAGDLDADSLAEVKDVAAASVSQGVSWTIAGASMVGALGYGLFEWRREFASGLGSIKSKFGISSD